MAQGIALHLGLNAVDPKHYSGWDGKLTACEADAEDMAQIAKSKGFSVRSLLTKAATRAAVKLELDAAAKKLAAGDIFFLSYSGHGGQVPDLNNDENDGKDETWCLYDGELIDDELYAALGKFAAGVRVLVLSDSCHSGTVTRAAYLHGTPAATSQVRYRAMPPEVALRTYRDNKEFYDTILTDKSLRKAADTVKASVILISGCQDNQYSSDGDFNGLFTGTLLKVWNHGAYRWSYKTFHKAIVRLMPPDQTPNYFKVGKSDSRFEKQKPFTL